MFKFRYFRGEIIRYLTRYYNKYLARQYDFATTWTDSTLRLTVYSATLIAKLNPALN